MFQITFNVYVGRQTKYNPIHTKHVYKACVYMNVHNTRVYVTPQDNVHIFA